MRKSFSSMIILSLTLISASISEGQQKLFLRHPSLGANQIAFAYAGNIWSADRNGGVGHPLTTGPGLKYDPFISPDSQWIAYSATYEDNTDVYVIPAQGGRARRLTFHPAPDEVVGWTPDSKSVLFRSPRNSYANSRRLFTVSLKGGLPQELPLPEGGMASYSTDGNYLAYVPIMQFSARLAWKHYRGGATARIWIARLSDSSIEGIPRENSNDFDPMWVGDQIYFLSDRDGPTTLFAYDVKAKKVRNVLPADGSDIIWASARQDAIVYEKLGELHTLDLSSGRESELRIEVASDLPQLHPHFEKVFEHIENYGLSPTGVRAVFEAHGEIFTVPVEKGDIRDLTNTPGVAEREPAWSPDGQWIAYFSDESGEYSLHLSSQDGKEVKKIGLGDPPSFFYTPMWSPDSSKIAYTDKRLNLWYVDVVSGTRVNVDMNYYESPDRQMNPNWSPDSKWLAYTKNLPTHFNAVYVYSLQTGKSNQITDGMSDALFPVFDKNGKYLYFTGSTDAGPSVAWLDLSSTAQPTTRSVYVVVLRKDQPSPLGPQSDEEPLAVQDQATGVPDAKDSKDAKATEKDQGKGKSPAMSIDFENIDQRTLALPIPARNYVEMQGGASGMLYLSESPLVPAFDDSQEVVIHRFELASRKTKKLLDGVTAIALSFDGAKMLYRVGPPAKAKWMVAKVPPPSSPDAPESAEAKLDGRPLRVEDAQVYMDPAAEWSQMFNEVWRIERDFFYDPGMHGMNWQAAKKYHGAFLKSVTSRDDLDYLLHDMLGDLTVGHLYLFLPPSANSTQPRTGLLGADYRIENGLYRLSHIYLGENWNPDLRAPLTEPGVQAHEGDYLLAVNGRELTSDDNIYSLFLGTAGKATILKLAADPSGRNAWTATAVPIADETQLRNRAWIDGNRHRVNELSGGRVAYVYLPNTGLGGYKSFNRYYFAQANKQAVVVDERYNSGGAAANYIIDTLRRSLSNYFFTREGHVLTTPMGSIFGPKAMITNQYSGSGGDILPWMFRQAQLGPLIGTRTWGAAVGIYDWPQLIDGSSVTAPRVAFFNLKGEWDIENNGVAPDVEVEFSPQAWRQGHDPQLERAVALVLDQLKSTTPPSPKIPPFPNYHQSVGKALSQ